VVVVRLLSLYIVYIRLEFGNAAVPWRAACVYIVCVRGVAMRWHAACLYLQDYGCG